MAGMIHIYCGEGKGKTTAALGLSLRSAGAGMKVLFAQFLKNGSSSELNLLSQTGRISVDFCPDISKFVFQMSPGERLQAAAEYTRLLERCLSRARAGLDMLVLDEVIPACNLNLLPAGALEDFLRHKPEGLEVVLTGRDPSLALLELADYVTEMKKIKHPYDRGLAARRGIEF